MAHTHLHVPGPPVELTAYDIRRRHARRPLARLCRTHDHAVEISSWRNRDGFVADLLQRDSAHNAQHRATRDAKTRQNLGGDKNRHRTDRPSKFSYAHPFDLLNISLRTIYKSVLGCVL